MRRPYSLNGDTSSLIAYNISLFSSPFSHSQDFSNNDNLKLMDCVQVKERRRHALLTWQHSPLPSSRLISTLILPRSLSSLVPRVGGGDIQRSGMDNSGGRACFDGTPSNPKKDGKSTKTN